MLGVFGDNPLFPVRREQKVTEPSPTATPGAGRSHQSRTIYVEWMKYAYSRIVHHAEGTGTWEKGADAKDAVIPSKARNLAVIPFPLENRGE